MAWSNRLKEVASSKPLFVTVYTTVIVGILVSSFYVFSSVFPGSGSFSSPWTSTSAILDVSPTSLNQVYNTSSQIVVRTVQEPTFQPQSKSLIPIWEVPPRGSKMPPLKTFRLTKELVQQRVKDNVIIVTFGIFAFLDFILTWVKHLSDMGVDNLLVGAMDTKLLEALYWKGIPVFDMASHMSTIDVGWGSPTFHKMGREKLRHDIQSVLAGDAYNIGIFHWRPTDSSKKLAKEWKEILLSDDKIWDQNGFNELVRGKLGPTVDEDSGLVYAYDGNLKLGLLPASLFCSGHTYFVQSMYQQLRLEPYAIHTTFQYAGTEGKHHRLHEATVFYYPPEYYDAPGGFLTFKPSIPKGLFLDGEHNIESHFALVNYQMKQIRTAHAIASLLNCTLVMPPLSCRLDRLWFGHPGVLAGTLTRQPFLCPLDHVFKVDTMLQKFPEEELGPGIYFREYSFFNNPSMPQQVKESWLHVQLCRVGSQGCQISNSTSQFRVLKFPKNSTEEMLKTIFSSLKTVKVIQFSSMQDAFLGFADKTMGERFRNGLKRYTDIWCCVENQTPGHIYYDMYWDEKPGWKRVPPQTPKEDHPPL